MGYFSKLPLLGATPLIMENDVLLKDETLTVQQERFCEAMVIMRSQSTAYRSAYNLSREAASPTSVYAQSRQLLNDPRIIARIKELNEASAAKTIVTKRELIQDVYDGATADTNEFQRVEAQNCRYCHGFEHRYRWRDDRELKEAVEDWLALKPETRGRAPDGLGGFGYKVRDRPHPDCYNCRGAGVIVLKITNSDDLTGGIRKLYKGAKVKSDGSVEILMHDQADLRAELAKMLGLYAGEGGQAAAGQKKPDASKTDPLQSARTYLEWVKQEKPE